MKIKIRKHKRKGRTVKAHTRKIYTKKNYGMGWLGKTDIPIVDAPESFGFKKEIKQMSPDEFLEFTRAESKRRTKGKQGYGYLESPEEYEKVVIFKPGLKRIKEGLKDPKPLVPEPSLEFGKEGEIESHEGRHRAVAAREVGIEKIPVHVIKPKNFGSWTALGPISPTLDELEEKARKKKRKGNLIEISEAEEELERYEKLRKRND